MTRNQTRASAAIACSLATLAAGCGQKSDSDKAKKASAAAAAQTFVKQNVPFTFSYPGDFSSVSADQLPKGFVAILGLDRVNFIDVRITAERAVTQAELPNVVEAAFKAQGVQVTSRERGRLAGRPLFTFVVKSKAAGADTTSRLQFFTAQKRTWEIGCQSDASGAGRIDAACRQALSSVALQF